MAMLTIPMNVYYSTQLDSTRVQGFINYRKQFPSYGWLVPTNVVELSIMLVKALDHLPNIQPEQIIQKGNRYIYEEVRWFIQSI